jgi:hypothetical protein
MTKQELINKVLENPEPACSARKLSCYGGYGSGYGLLTYQGKWMFIPHQTTDKSFEPTDEFVIEVIKENWRKLLRYYK